MPAAACAVVLSAAGVALFAAAGTLEAPALSAQRPDVVVIQTDDQTLSDLYATLPRPGGGRIAVMPVTRQRIGDRGVTFNRYYASTPLCCPSRTTLLTGRYSHNHRVLNNDSPGGYPGFRAHDLRDNIAIWLQDAGYRTVHVGKFLNHYGGEDPLEEPPGWNEWRTLVNDARYFYGYQLNRDGELAGPFGDRTYALRDDPGCPDPTPPQPCNYLTDALTSYAVDAISGAGARPLYLQLDYTAPHGDVLKPPGPEPAPRDDGSVGDIRAPRVPGFDERDIADKPRFIRRIGRLTPSEIHRLDLRYQDRIEALRSVDEGIGRVLDALAARSGLTHAYVFFLSDNGFFQGEHRFDVAKFLPYEPANHLPLLVRGPGIPADRHSGELIANVDIAPTLLEITGATPSIAPDGRSILPFARDLGRRTRRPILLEGFAEGSGEPGNSRAGASIAATPRDYEGIRFSHWKYVEYRSGEAELYDLRIDPHELRSLAREPRYRSLRSWFHRRLATLQGCAGESCRRPLRGPLPNPIPLTR